ncbi:MAG: hypothetical protein ABW073_02935 [Acidimicrobiia bacterium]
MLFAMIAALGLLAMFAGPANAGFSGNMVTIKKVVVGPVPAGTTFTVHVSCQVTLGKSLPATYDVVFNAAGVATSGNSVITTQASSECVATETVTGGANTVAYGCTSTGSRATCDPSGTSVEFVDVTGSTGTITVTNTFPDPPPVVVVALEVIVAPAFTG